MKGALFGRDVRIPCVQPNKVRVGPRMRAGPASYELANVATIPSPAPIGIRYRIVDEIRLFLQEPLLQ